jgi:hypothetical protein
VGGDQGLGPHVERVGAGEQIGLVRFEEGEDGGEQAGIGGAGAQLVDVSPVSASSRSARGWSDSVQVKADKASVALSGGFVSAARIAYLSSLSRGGLPLCRARCSLSRTTNSI